MASVCVASQAYSTSQEYVPLPLKATGKPGDTCIPTWRSFRTSGWSHLRRGGPSDALRLFDRRPASEGALEAVVLGEPLQAGVHRAQRDQRHVFVLVHRTAM
jgi:hypothetical protein